MEPCCLTLPVKRLAFNTMVESRLPFYQSIAYQRIARGSIVSLRSLTLELWRQFGNGPIASETTDVLCRRLREAPIIILLPERVLFQALFASGTNGYQFAPSFYPGPTPTMREQMCPSYPINNWFFQPWQPHTHVVTNNIMGGAPIVTFLDFRLENLDHVNCAFDTA